VAIAGAWLTRSEVQKPRAMALLNVSMRVELAPKPEFLPAEPLWKRAPSHDEYGRPLGDFMMIIPRLSSRSIHYVQSTLRAIDAVLKEFYHAVVFADMNLRLNILWVSVRPIPGICFELASAIKLQVPEALLVAHRLE
jgi:hypothetical protein